MSDSRIVQLLDAEHAEGLRALCEEPDVAAVVGLNTGISLEAANEYITMANAAQEAGRAYIFVLTQAGTLMGVCRLIGVLGVPRLIVAVGHAWRGQGNGAILVRHVLKFAFETLGLDRVTATGACLRLVSQQGRIDGNVLSRDEWRVAQGDSPQPQPT